MMERNTQKESQVQIRERMNREFLELTSNALDALRDMISDPGINPIARVQAIGLILDRGLGKPEENIRIQDEVVDRESARKRLEAIAARIREEVDKES